MIRSYFKEWNLFEKLFTIIAIITSVIFSIIWNSWWVESLSSIFGIIWIMLLAKGKVEGYVVGFIATIFYAWASIYYKYYGELIISIFITTPLNVWGFCSVVKKYA